MEDKFDKLSFCYEMAFLFIQSEMMTKENMRFEEISKARIFGVYKSETKTKYYDYENDIDAIADTLYQKFRKFDSEKFSAKVVQFLRNCDLIKLIGDTNHTEKEEFDFL